MRQKEPCRRLIFCAGMLILILSGLITGGALAEGQKAITKSGVPEIDIPEPQGFCGYCHILTYPAIFNKSHETWKKGKHNEVGCVECHYPPRQGEGSDSAKPSRLEDEKGHIPAVPPGHFSYVALGGETIKTIPKIINDSCMTVACHGKPEDKFRTKKIKFTEKVPFVHEPHLVKENQIEGMQVNCTTCHQHETESKHFQVSETSCHLCHFANTKFNQGRARCELCHQLPTEPIKTAETSDDKAITHKMLKEGGVSCGSCHYDLIQGTREAKIEPFFEGGVLKTALFVGAGRIREKNCTGCHDQENYLKEMAEKKVMHETHVTTKNARCLDCHLPIRHRKAEVNRALPGGCTACHSDPHNYQRLLAAGPERDDVPALPDRMFQARTNCLGCHTEKKNTHRGQTVMRATAKSCVECHTKDYETMLGMWKRELSQEVERVKRLEKEALEALAKYKPELTQEKFIEAGEMLNEGRENLSIVQFGNGVHNTKYSISLLDVAMNRFKDMIAYVEGKETTEDLIQEE